MARVAVLSINEHLLMNHARSQYEIRERTTWKRRLTRLFAMVFGVLLFIPAPLPAEEEVDPPDLKVRGYGIWGNRDLRRTIELLDTEEDRTHYDANFIEDAVFILNSRLQQDGYLRPKITARVILEDGTEERFTWDERLDVLLPRPMRATAVRFQIDEGILFYYENVEFEGLTVIDENEALPYFVATDILIRLKRTRVFTPRKLDTSIENLREVLEGKGYEQARVVLDETDRDDETGAVSVRIRVREGKQSIIRSSREEVYVEGEEEPSQTVEREPGRPYSRMWVQDSSLDLRNSFYRQGYPDARVEVQTLEREELEDRIEIDLLFRVRTGNKVYLGDVVFDGSEKTRESVLRRRVMAGSGDELDRLEMDQARYRLARLGVFDSVEVEYEEVDEETRNVVFRLVEGKEVDISLLLGYGSYELLRGGLEIEQYNIFGRAHRSRLMAIQSFKSSSLDYRYTMPEVFGENINAFGQATALRREEIDFMRTEYGGTAGLQTFYSKINSDLTLRYSYQLLQSTRFDAIEEDGIGRAQVGSVGFDIRHDERDNPIYPRDGYNLFGITEAASEYFLGEANYQRLEIGASWHKGIGRGAYINVGFTHGLVHAEGEVGRNLPFNKRFFPGGDSSIRGYQFGQAGSRNEAGRLAGSETYSLLNLEFEQVVTPSWSVVLFSDSLAIARRFDSYPADEELYSVGGGIRYKTFIGPIRLEYGHNLNPRERDPSGTLHLSIGFPF